MTRWSRREGGQVLEPVLPRARQPVDEDDRRSPRAEVDDVDGVAPRRAPSAGARASRCRATPSGLSGRRRAGSRQRASADSIIRAWAALAGPGTRMRIAIDIDSTLHHYWDLLSAAARRRFGVDLPYERQLTWGITGLRAEQLHACIEETHGADVIAAGRALPRRRRDGQPLGTTRATSSTSPATAPRTPTTRRRRGCDGIGLRYDELYCSYDKVTRCVEIDIDVLIDDSPVNLAARHRGRHHAGHDPAPVEPRRLRGGGRHLRRATGPSWRASSTRCSRDDRRPAHQPARGPRRGGRGRVHARPAARHRARAAGDRLGPVRARRGRARPHALRLPLPPVVPLRGRGHRERAGRRRRAAGLQPLRARCRPTRR